MKISLFKSKQYVVERQGIIKAICGENAGGGNQNEKWRKMAGKQLKPYLFDIMMKFML